MALAATTLALAGTGAAFAGTCVNPAPGTMECTGSFIDTLTFPDADLTLVLGDGVPTSVTPAVGDIGVDASWPGRATVVSHADITTDSADGIHADSSRAAHITNHGSVTTYVGADGVQAIDILAGGDASFANTGDVLAYGFGVYDVTAVRAETAGCGCEVSVDNQAGGSIQAFAFGGGDAVGIYGYSTTGDISITNDGDVIAISAHGLADGLFASGAEVSVANGGAITALGYGWAAGIEAQGSDLTTVSNTGIIAAVSQGAYGEAFGIYATGGSGGVAVDNRGLVVVTGPYATGIHADAAGDVTIGNSGTLSIGSMAYSYYATGISAGSGADGAAITIDNDGTVAAASYYGSRGIEATATGVGSTVGVTNTGSIHASQDYKYGVSLGIVASADGDADIDNAGLIRVDGGDGAYGAMALSFNGMAAVDNSGDIVVTGSALASSFGIVATSQNGGADVVNGGGVSVDGGKYAYGVLASGTGDVSIGNTADGRVHAYSGLGLAMGLAGTAGQGDVSVDNAGLVFANGLTYGIGIYAASQLGDVEVANDGNILAIGYYGAAFGVLAGAESGTAIVDNDGMATAISAYGDAVGIRASGDTAYVHNSGYAIGSVYGNGTAFGIRVQGTVLAQAVNDRTVWSTSDYGQAIGVAGASYGGDVALANSGSVLADGATSAIGMYAGSQLGAVGLQNTGYVGAQSTDGSAIGLAGAGYAGDIAIANASGIGAVGHGEAIGIYAYSVQGSIDVRNDGDIRASSASGLTDGIFASGVDVSVGNDGRIFAAGYDWAAGVEAQGGDWTTVANTGDIIALAAYGEAFGVYATAGAGGAAIDNQGVVYALGLYATGIQAMAGGDITIANHGDLAVGSGAYTIYATGIAAASGADGTAIAIDNAGTIVADSYYGSRGIEATATGVGSTVNVSNTGSIHASQDYKYGVSLGIVASADGDADIDNSGLIEVSGGDNTYGVAALSFNGDASVTNSGDIRSDGGLMASTAGIIASSQNGAAYVLNSGMVESTGKYVYGMLASSSGVGDVDVVNTADGVVVAYSGLGFAMGVVGTAAHGDVEIDNAGLVYANGLTNGIGVYAMSQLGDVDVANDGDILAASYYYAAFGVFARAPAGDVAVGNDGIIVAASYYSDAVGIAARGDVAAVVNGGGVTALAYGAAYGIQVQGAGHAGVANEGTVDAMSLYDTGVGVAALSGAGTAQVDNGGSIGADSYHGDAIGVFAGGALADVGNSGDIRATAYGAAYGVQMVGGVGLLDNSGTLEATSLGGSGTATGALVYGAAGVHVVNSGSIDAHAYGSGIVGTHADTIGLHVVSGGPVLVENSGTITATDEDMAVAVLLQSPLATLENTGLLRTYAPGEGQIAVLGGDGIEQVLNYGRIDGALVLGDGDDILLNANGGVWNVLNHSTDFGDGDDTVFNGGSGTIALDGGAIHLGGSSDGNRFINNGLVTVSGDNLVDMGAGNALPLSNNGLVSFLDGATDDLLAIVGDLAGNGGIAIDLDAMAGGSDLLYITGNVDGSQRVDVDFGGIPTAAMTTLTPFAYVDGDSNASSFVGGSVNSYTPGNFLDLRVRIVGEIDASNATADVFSVGLEAAGLDDMGALAASVATGAQVLLNSQVGTWRQRMGVLQGQGGYGPSPWLRYFDDRGDISQEQVARNFGQGGNFGFHQAGSGWEVGVDARPGERLHVGVLAGKSEATQRLRGGAGSDRIDARSFGVYGTWTGDRGFYLDASYRWTGFDARLRAGGMHHQTSAEAGTANVEAGFTAWQVGGFDIQPQAQYTRTRIGDMETLHGPLVDFNSAGGVSERGRLGVSFTKTIDGSGGWAWMPHAALSAVHEFDGGYAYALSNGFFGETRIDGTSALVELGIGARRGRLQLGGGLNWTDGGAYDSFLGGQMVVRYNW